MYCTSHSEPAKPMTNPETRRIVHVSINPSHGTIPITFLSNLTTRPAPRQCAHVPAPSEPSTSSSRTSLASASSLLTPDPFSTKGEPVAAKLHCDSSRLLLGPLYARGHWEKFRQRSSTAENWTRLGILIHRSRHQHQRLSSLSVMELVGRACMRSSRLRKMCR